MFWVSDVAGAVIYVSTEWQALTGQPVGEARGLGWLKQVHPDDRNILLDLFFEASSNRQSYVVEYRLRTLTGSFIWASVSAAPSILPDSGRFLGYFGTVNVSKSEPLPDKAHGKTSHRQWPARLTPDLSTNAIEELADLFIASRSIAETSRNKMLLSIVDLALVEIGFCLAQGSDESGSDDHSLNS